MHQHTSVLSPAPPADGTDALPSPTLDLAQLISMARSSPAVTCAFFLSERPRSSARWLSVKLLY